MYDKLPFPNVVGSTLEEQTFQINNYLIQLKEALEFILSDISEENLSQELVTKLNSLGANIEKSNEEREDQISQVSNKLLSTSDIVNSASFKAALSSSVSDKVSDIKFSVNFDTGNLEYTTS